VELSDDTRYLFVTYEKRHESPGKYQNIALAIATTAYARIELYAAMDRAPHQVVYLDTVNKTCIIYMIAS